MTSAVLGSTDNFLLELSTGLSRLKYMSLNILKMTKFISTTQNFTWITSNSLHYKRRLSLIIHFNIPMQSIHHVYIYTFLALASAAAPTEVLTAALPDLAVGKYVG